MLWYKAWRESRVRFLLVGLFVVYYTAFTVLTKKRALFPLETTSVLSSSGTYIGYVYGHLYAGKQLSNLFLAYLVPLLSMGGLLRERGRGTAALSLSLPVSRLRLLGVRAGLGLLQITALTFVPAILIPALSPIVAESYPISLALHFALLWTVCSSVVFAMAFLLSAVLAGEYTALLVSFMAILLYEGVTAASFHQRFQRFSLTWIMEGMRGARAPDLRVIVTGLPEPLPWATLFVFAAIAFALLATATRITQQQDF